MFKRLKALFHSWREQRILAREMAPGAFRSLAQELRDLSRAVEKLCPPEHAVHAKIKGIQMEMDQLDRLASRPEFKQLSYQKRLLLRASLLQSMEQLTETVQSAPSPTTTLQ